jgi:tetratricopeptide (TPR) repeat protein
VEALEALYPDRLAEQVERLAHHACRGEVWPKAVAYLRQAGAKASARSALHEAVGYFEQALAALGHLPESEDTLAQAIDIRVDLRNVLYPLGEFGRLSNYLREADALAAALNDQSRLAWVSCHLSTFAWLTGDPDHAVESAQRARAIAHSVGEVALEVEATHRLGITHWTMGDYHRATECFAAVGEFVQGDLLQERFGLYYVPSAISKTLSAVCLAELGEFREAIPLAEEGVRIAEAVNHPFTVATAYFGLGHAYLRQGDFDQAIPTLEHSLDLCRKWQTQMLFPMVAPDLGHVYAHADRVTEALAFLEQVFHQATSIGYVAFQAIRAAWLSHAYLLAGRRGEAAGAAACGLALARRHKERGHEAWALRLLGEIAASGEWPEAEQAEARYRQALALAEELGMRPLQARCHFGLGTLYQRVGRHEVARAELATAAELYRAMEMPFWLDKAEAALAQVANLTAKQPAAGSPEWA